MGRYKEPYTLYKRGKYWYYRTYDNRGVRTHGISTGKTSKTAARDFCESLYKSNQLSVSYNKTYKEYAENFFATDSVYVREKTTLAHSSAKIYRSMNVKIIEYLGHLKLIDITNSKIKEFRIDLLDNEYSIKYINTVISVLSIVLKQAYVDMLIPRNPCEGVTALVNTQKGRDSLTLDEVRQLYQQSEYEDLVILLALTGLRISEARGLTTSDFLGTDMKYIHLTKQIVSRGVYTPLKNKKERDIPVIEKIKPLDTYLHYMTIVDSFRPLFECLDPDGSRKLSLHSFRHFFITNSKASGISPLIVETIAGHSLKGIEGVYTNFKVDDLKPILEWQQKTYEYITK